VIEFAGVVAVVWGVLATPRLSTALLVLFGETPEPGALLSALLVLVCNIGVLSDGMEGARLIGVAWLIGWVACVVPSDFTM
jgi:hypothetical protein